MQDLVTLGTGLLREKKSFNTPLTTGRYSGLSDNLIAWDVSDLCRLID